jgi:hypothetical protein
MKKHLLSAIIALTVLFSAQAKAVDCLPTPPSCPPTTPTHLPINNGIAFLLVAGVVIGITTVNKNKISATKA